MRDGHIPDPGVCDAASACAYCPDGGREPAAADSWPPDRLAHLYLCRGLSTYVIAGISGIDRQRVTRLLRRAGVPVRPRGAGRLRPVRRNDPPGLPQLISELYEAGRLSSRQIGSVTGLPERSGTGFAGTASGPAAVDAGIARTAGPCRTRPFVTCTSNSG